jgi:hypothetical protein
VSGSVLDGTRIDPSAMLDRMSPQSLVIGLLVTLLPAAGACAQFSYDFNALNGSDTHPFTSLGGQDNWTDQAFNASNSCGVTATMSHDGTKCLWFQEAGPGYGCDASRINAGPFAPFVGLGSNAMFEVDIKVGFWGGSFGLAHDTSGDGIVRGNQPGELGVRFTVGAQVNTQFRLYAADQTFVQVPLASVAQASGGDWLRVRVVMDLPAAGATGTGSVFAKNLTNGDTVFSAVSGLLDISLALNVAAADATNPLLWDAVWLHFEGATYALDNLNIGYGSTAVVTGSSCSTALRAATLPTLGTSWDLELDSPAGTLFGVHWFGATNPNIVDLTFLGLPGCGLYANPDYLVGPWVPTGPTYIYSFAIPATPASLLGFDLFTQAALAPTPPPNAFGLVTTNGVKARVGNL